MALYLGNNKVSMKSGYTTTGLKDFLEHNGKFSGTNYTDLNDILKYEDTENLRYMYNFFKYCEKITSIPKLNTSNAINMFGMFEGCTKLISIPQLDTHNCSMFHRMFYSCINLTSIPKLNTSKADTMNDMFYNCQKLTIIPQLDASNVTNLNNIFYDCSNLEQIHMTGMKASFNISASTLFTRDALLEILNNLATVTSTKTLTMSSTNLAKLTDEDKSIATNKGWTLA